MSVPTNDALLADLAQIVGAAGVKDPETVAGLDPGLRAENLAAGVIVLPASTAEVAEVVAYCCRHSIAIVPQGGRTGISGGAVSHAGQIILQTTRMDRILSVDPLAGTAVVEAGAILETVEAAVAEQGLSVGLDLSARGSATIGGMVSTNAGGIEAFRHGVMRHRVLGLEAVLPDGRVLDDLKQVTKANEDVCQRRRKKGPPRRCKKGPLGGCGLVPVVHGRAPRATRRALNRLTRRRAREGPVGPRGQAWAGWSVQLAVGV